MKSWTPPKVAIIKSETIYPGTKRPGVISIEWNGMIPKISISWFDMRNNITMDITPNRNIPLCSKTWMSYQSEWGCQYYKDEYVMHCRTPVKSLHIFCACNFFLFICVYEGRWQPNFEGFLEESHHCPFNEDGVSFPWKILINALLMPFSRFSIFELFLKNC